MLRRHACDQRLGRQPQEALKTARQLVKHQGLSKAASQGLLRSLAFECLDTAHDIDQLKRIWLSLDAADRRDNFVAARAAVRAAHLGSTDEARSWLRPAWDRIEENEFADTVTTALASVFPADPPRFLARTPMIDLVTIRYQLTTDETAISPRMNRASRSACETKWPRPIEFSIRSSDPAKIAWARSPRR